MLFIVIALAGCKDKIDDSSKRNEHYVWWVDAKTGKAGWIPVEGPGMPVQNGKFTRFYFNGKVFSKGRLVDGELVDTLFSYGLNGKLFEYMFVEKGDTIRYFPVDGYFKAYSQNSKLWGEGTIQAHVRAHWRQYYDSGKLESVYNVKNDTGWVNDYYENGNKSDSGYFEGGIKSENIRHWSESGQLLSAVYYKAGTHTGYWEMYYWNGQLESKGYLVNGAKQGEIDAWFINGKRKLIQHLKNEKINGPQVLFYEDGKIKEVKNYKMNVPDGEAVMVYENGRVKIHANYTNGELNGERKTYNEDGKLTSDEVYKDGYMISKKL